jgi:long-chain acyl-CoA synthetase
MGTPTTIAELFSSNDPAREALVTRSGRYTYGTLDEMANRAASVLARQGVKAGDRVAATLPNDTDVVVAFHGAMRIGAIWVGINRALAAPEKAFMLEDSGAAILLCDAPTAEQVGTLCPTLLVEPDGQWGQLMAASDAATFPKEAIDPFAPAGIAYTSGTTGFPKGAVHSQHNMLLPGAVLVASRGYDATLRKGDCFPLTILNMQVLTTLLTAQAGGCAIVMDRIDSDGVTAWIRDERVTTWNGPPALLHTLAFEEAVSPADFVSLREVWSGGADCPESLREAFAAKFGLPLMTTYGLSEAPTVVSIDPIDGDHVVGASGQVLPHLVVSSVDDELCVAPRSAGPWAGRYRPMLGYWQRDTSAVVDGVLHTGDIGAVSSDGWLSVRDRKNLVILRGGANVYPAEVERVINLVPGVVASAVIGIADERLGERVVAAVQVAPGVSVEPSALTSLCLANLAKYKVPERWVFVDEFVRNSMGKIQRQSLVSLF